MKTTDIFAGNAHVPEAMRKQSAEENKRWNDDMGKQNAKGRGGQAYRTFLVTARGKMFVVVAVERKDSLLDDASLKIITDSFKFL